MKSWLGVLAVAVLGLALDAGTAQAGLGSEEGIEVDGENVSLDDLDIGEHAEAKPKLGGQHTVQFHSDEAADTLGEQGSEHAASGADFEHGVLRYIAEGSDNLLGKTVAGKEMLSQLGLVLRTAGGDDEPPA